jgi:hypothetical protein
MENVSKEIEFEEQLLGMKEEQGDDPEDDGDQGEQKEDAFDMEQNDFQGKTKELDKEEHQ